MGNKRKNKLTGILAALLAIYISSATVMSFYYWWKDVKSHDSFSRAILVSPFIGLFKSTHWPYYAFFQNEPRINIDDKTRQSIDGFFTGYEYSLSANKLTRDLLASKDMVGDLEKIKSLLRESKNRFYECDIEKMNQIYTGWGDNISDKIIPAIDFLIAGTEPNGDRNDLIRGDALMADVNTWLGNNWNEILLRLNEKYGYEIKKGD
jgi:hypothetical protein